MLDFNTASERIKKIRTVLSSKFGVKKIGIFGSVARNEQKEGSDIDILVELSHKVSLLQFSGLWVDLEEELKDKVDVADINDLRPELAEIIKKEVRYI
jgi:uncharacterized protein